jgi:2',3'-cyclic-nucleotide 2'-phosphodiesterase (5'-nucleotidase family)
VKIGIVGLTAEDSHAKSSPGDLKIEPALATGIKQAEALRRDGAHLIIGVVHTSRRIDRELFESRGLDLLLSGDDHDLLVQFDGRTALVESSSQGEYVTAIDLTIETGDRDGRPDVTWRPDFRIIDSADVEPDPEVGQRIAGFEAEFSRELEVVVGRTATELDSRRTTIRSGEAAIGNLITDAMRETVGAELGLMNSGGIRANKRYPAGTEISRKDILAELPFGNRVVKLEVRGDILRSALENGFSQVEEDAGRFPQVSGMVVEADLKAPAGNRVKSVMINGAPLDPAQTYTMATVDFLTGGGDGYGLLVDAPRILNERDGPLLAAAVMAHIRKRGEVSPALEGRIKATR